MCGIGGIWGRDDRDTVGAMVAAMRHRGPDDTGVYSDQRVSLGMARLAIIDPSSGGHQPMQTPDGDITAVYNGELYNFQTEKELLEKRGFTFSSTSDTEVVLRMYEHYGDDFLKRMRGMFALAVYDRRRGRGRERLLLARDQMGIKPLLYTWVNGCLAFASEIKGLLASDLVAADIDPIALRLLLTYGSVYQPRTILRNVSMLLPAHRMIIEAGGTRIERYWSLGIDRRDDLRRRSYAEQVEEIRSTLEESVRLQMVSDVPLGAFLSGGVDSSLLVALLARQMSGGAVKTFSVGFQDEGRDIDETDDAQKTAEYLGTDHSRVVVTEDDVRERISHIASALDQPTVDGVNSYFISLAARQRVTVAISGTGGDEFFAGYPWFAQTVLGESALKHPLKDLARAAVAPAVRLPFFSSLPEGRMRRRIDQLRYTSDFLTRYAQTYNIFGAEGARGILGPDIRHEAQVGASAYHDLAATDELPHGSVIERVTGMCLRGYTTNQLLRDIDAASMSHSLEVRVPYLDPVVADAALSLPDRAKLSVTSNGDWTESRSYRESGTKQILLDVAKPLLPAGFDEKPKRGFGMPFDSWLKGSLREVLDDTLSAQSVRARGLLDPLEVSSTRDQFFSGGIQWPRVWLLMMIELWSREVLDRSRGSLSQAMSDRQLAVAN